MDKQVIRVVLDIGTHETRYGRAGEGKPMGCIKTCVSRTKDANAFDDRPKVGLYNPTLYHTAYPVRNGYVNDWGAMEVLLKYVFKDMDVVPGECAVCWTTSAPPTDNPAKLKRWKTDREKMTVLFFEKMGVNALYCVNKSAVAMAATGSDTGLVVDMGHDTTTFVPVYKGSSMQAHVSNFGMTHLGAYLHFLLDTQHPKLQVTADMLEKIRAETVCFHSDYSDAIGAFAYNNRVLDLGQAFVEAGELLFSCGPQHTNFFDPQGIHESVLYTIGGKAPQALHRSMFENIIVTGGGSQLKKLGAKLQKEVIYKEPHLMYRCFTPECSEMLDIDAAFCGSCGEEAIPPKNKSTAFNVQVRCVGPNGTWHGASLLADKLGQQEWFPATLYTEGDAASALQIHYYCWNMT